MRVAGLHEQVGGGHRFQRRRSHPASGALADILGDNVGAFLDDALLVMLPERCVDLPGGAAMGDDVVAAFPDLLGEVRVLVADGAVQQDRARQLELLQQLEQPPLPDADSVIAPRVVARVLSLAMRRIGAEAGAERKMLDVACDIEGKPLAAGPAVVVPLVDVEVIVAIVPRKLQHASLLAMDVDGKCRRRPLAPNRALPGSESLDVCARSSPAAVVGIWPEAL